MGRPEAHIPIMGTEGKENDLFAGLGGIRIGFEQALKEMGMTGQCAFTSEIKPSAIKALNHNFPGENIRPTDITQTSSDSIPSFNVLLGGFPCQAFSSAGAQKGFADTRGTLFFEIERILKDHLAEVDGFILENVEGLITHNRKNPNDQEGQTIKTIMHVLRDKLDFNADYVLLNAADFGVPQSRKRVYIVGCKKKYGQINLKFIPKEHTPAGTILEHGKPLTDNAFSKKLLQAYTCSEIQGKSLKDKRGGRNNIHSWDIGLKGEVSNEEKILLNKLLLERRRRKWANEIGIDWMDGMPLTCAQIQTFYNSDHLQEMLTHLTKLKYLSYEYPKKKITNVDSHGNHWSSRVPDTSKPKGYNIITGKLSFEFSAFLDNRKPASTIVAMDMGTIGVTDTNGIRHLTLREGLRLFGYPDEYSLSIFEKTQRNIEQGYDLIGNTVCVPVIKAVSERFLEKLIK